MCKSLALCFLVSVYLLEVTEAAKGGSKSMMNKNRLVWRREARVADCCSGETRVVGAGAGEPRAIMTKTTADVRFLLIVVLCFCYS